MGSSINKPWVRPIFENNAHLISIFPLGSKQSFEIWRDDWPGALSERNPIHLFYFGKNGGAINSNNSRPLCVFGLSVFKKTNDNKIQRPLDANTLVIYLLFFTKIYYLPHLPAFSRSAFCLCPPRSFYLRCYEKRASQLPRTGLPFDQKIFKKLSVHIDETLSGWPALKDNQSMCRAVRSP